MHFNLKKQMIPKFHFEDFNPITSTEITESNFLKRGYLQSRNTTVDRYDNRPPREQLGVRPLGKSELVETMVFEIH